MSFDPQIGRQYVPSPRVPQGARAGAGLDALRSALDRTGNILLTEAAQRVRADQESAVRDFVNASSAEDLRDWKQAVDANPVLLGANPWARELFEDLRGRKMAAAEFREFSREIEENPELFGDLDAVAERIDAFRTERLQSDLPQAFRSGYGAAFDEAAARFTDRSAGEHLRRRAYESSVGAATTLRETLGLAVDEAASNPDAARSIIDNAAAGFRAQLGRGELVGATLDSQKAFAASELVNVILDPASSEFVDELAGAYLDGDNPIITDPEQRRQIRAAVRTADAQKLDGIEADAARIRNEATIRARNSEVLRAEAMLEISRNGGHTTPRVLAIHQQLLGAQNPDDADPAAARSLEEYITSPLSSTLERSGLPPAELGLLKAHIRQSPQTEAELRKEVNDRAQKDAATAASLPALLDEIETRFRPSAVLTSAPYRNVLADFTTRANGLYDPTFSAEEANKNADLLQRFTDFAAALPADVVQDPATLIRTLRENGKVILEGAEAVVNTPAASGPTMQELVEAEAAARETLDSLVRDLRGGGPARRRAALNNYDETVSGWRKAAAELRRAREKEADPDRIRFSDDFWGWLWFQVPADLSGSSQR